MPQDSQEDEQRKKGSLKKGQGAKRPFITPMSIRETLSLQLKSLSRAPVYKAISMTSFLALLILPYIMREQYWPWLVGTRDGASTGLFNTTDHRLKAFLISFSWSNVLVVVLYSVYGLLYWLKSPAVEKFKDNDVPWPWESEPDWKEKVYKGIKVTIINRFIVTGILGYLSYLAGGGKTRVALEQVPSFPVYVSQILFMILCEDFLFFWVHKIMHYPFMYRNFHKVHHEFFNSIILACGYNTPFEWIFGNLLPSIMGGILLGGRAHLLSTLVFIALRLVETCEAHSGYDFPISVTKYLPLSCSSSYHNHHHLVNIGNYGSFFVIWDSICGTNSYYFEKVGRETKKNN